MRNKKANLQIRRKKAEACMKAKKACDQLCNIQLFYFSLLVNLSTIYTIYMNYTVLCLT